MTLEACGLGHSYGERPVVRQLDLSLKSGECVALIGPNGAGKTTVLRALAGLLEPASGVVKLNGTPLSSIRREEIARSVSVVPQARPAAFAFTALEYVLMGFHARVARFQLEGDAERASAHAALEVMGVAEFASRPMTQLSGGEAQRVVMARTIASGAAIWLLDEPTSNLDIGHQIALLEAVRRHCDDGGTALAIVHDPNLANRWFDRVVVLADGVLVAEGEPDQCLTEDVFRTAFGVGMRFVGDEKAGAWVPMLDPEPPRSVEPSGSAEEEP